MSREMCGPTHTQCWSRHGVYCSSAEHCTRKVMRRGGNVYARQLLLLQIRSALEPETWPLHISHLFLSSLAKVIVNVVIGKRTFSGYEKGTQKQEYGIPQASCTTPPFTAAFPGRTGLSSL